MAQLLVQGFDIKILLINVLDYFGLYMKPSLTVAAVVIIKAHRMYIKK